MFSENVPEPGMNQAEPEPDEIEPISPEDAEAILTQAMEPYLADGWTVLRQGAYFARLTRGSQNLDIRVDLLGAVEMEESDLTPVQDSGRLIAWMVLLMMLMIALALFSALGIL